MLSYDLKELLLLAEQKGICIEDICNMLNVPLENVNKYVNNSSLELNEIMKLEPLNLFLYDLLISENEMIL